jgi:hydrogenase-4 membrane subunit HyfE
MDLKELVSIVTVTNIVVICAVLTALYNAFTRKLQSKISSYRLQILALTLLAVVKAINTSPWFLLIALILLIQFFVITPLVAYVTNSEQRQPGQSILSFLGVRFDIVKARSSWLEYNPENNPKVTIVRTSPLTSLIISSVLVIIAYIVANQVAPQFTVAKFNGLVASLALLLVGLFIMINAYDTLSQMMGLLVMENGLFLAVVIVVTDPGLLPAFILSMFAWYTLTLIILVTFLPRLRQYSGSIYVGDQRELKE